MSRNEVMVVIKSLSRSQGLYGRILSQLENMEEGERNEFLDSFEGCKDAVDMVMLIEC